MTHPCNYPSIPIKVTVPVAPLIKKPINLNEIFEDVCIAMGMPIDLVKAGRRKHEHVICRQIYCYVARNKTNYSLNAIGWIINRDHTTVVHSTQMITDLLDVRDSRFLNDWEKYLDNSKLFNKYDF